MSEYELVEDDIWEYKSIRRQKSNKEGTGNLRKFIQSGKKNNKGESTSSKSGNRKNNKTSGHNKQPEKSESEPKQNLNKEENLISPSQESVTSSAKQNRSSGKKQSPQNARPIYHGYCPSCQMPFSLLLVQTPRWHAAECLDTPGCTDKECPDGLQCNSTIPSHYKRYTHFLLARSRSGDDCVISEMYTSDRKPVSSDAAESGCFTAFKDETESPKQRLSSQKGKSSEIHLKAGPTRTHWQSKSLKQSTLQFTQSVDAKEHFDLSQSQDSKIGGEASEHLYELLPMPDVDSSNSEISYSPLVSDNDETGKVGKLRRSRKRLFSVGKSEEEQREANVDCCAALSKLSDVPKGRGCGVSFTLLGSGLGTSDSFSEQVSQNDTLSPSSSSDLLGQSSVGDPPFFLEPQKIKEEPDWPEFGSPVSGTSQSTSKEPGAATCLSPVWVRSNMVLSVKAEDEGLFHSFQSDVVEELKVKDDVSSSSLSGAAGKLFDGISGFNTSLSHSVGKVKPPFLKNISVSDQNVPVKRLSSTPVPNASVKSISHKGLKQTDIGVFFGLKPRAKEEKERENLALLKKGANPMAAPNVKGPKQKKRKATGSAGNAETSTGAWDRGGVSGEITSSGQRGWKKRFRESSTAEGREKKQCPFYKKIAGTGFVVDAFQYGEIEGCTAYFLTHFHGDHYGGLTRKFNFPIYCSKITGNLVRSKLHVEEQYINCLPMDTECMVNGVKVTLLEANHCPGAVLFLFCLPSGISVLHTGDFRAHPSMEIYPALISRKIHTLYLDTTYCSPEYTFPSQQEAIQFAVRVTFEAVTLHPGTLVVCGTYSVGKEKVFLAIAEVLGCKVSMSQDKYKTMQCLESEQVESLITMDWNSAGLHVLPMMKINFKGLLNHLIKFPQYDRVLAFKPTGWTYSDQFSSVADIRPEIMGNITIYGIPYSEHSSYLELKRFVQWLRPQRIIPTVNVGSWKSRSTMEKYFRGWLAEPAYTLVIK